MLFTREQEKLSQTLYLSHGGSFIVQVTHSGKQALNEWSLSPEHLETLFKIDKQPVFHKSMEVWQEAASVEKHSSGRSL